MTIKNKVKNAILDIDIYHQKRWLAKYEIKKINMKSSLWKQVEITTEDKTKIDAIYGKDSDKRWHRYYAYFTGKMDYKYLPENVYSTKLEWVLNPYRLCCALEDKALLPMMFGDVEGICLPRTVICKSYGRYTDANENLIDEKKAIEQVRLYLEGNKNAIYKPTRDTSSGRGVELITLGNYMKVLSETQENYIVQELLVNQSDIKALNPSSLNTLRVMTYICNEKYYCAPILMRMGVGDKVVDNAHAGGIFIGVNTDGTLCDQAFSEYGEKHSVHPATKIRFAGYQISNVGKVIDAAIACHKKLPQLGMISWDFTLNQDGVPTLIESNLFGQSVWLPQIAHGKSIFGENTLDMLKLIQDE